jgi:predicted Ser/Thr protein kinase
VNCYRCDTPVPDSSHFCQACGADVSGGGPASAVVIERDPELEEKLAAELEGEFVIERILGRGGMGTVFLARDLHLHRNVAIKVLPPELTYGPGMVERFKREARTAATLDHSHIVPIYRISSTGKIVWFAMKYIEGETLATVLEREKILPPDRAAAILTRVAEALEFAHQHGVIHRDIKPANVMLDRRGWVTVTDFGIAKALDTSSLTGSGALIGTPFYMSPEQCSGKKTITGATDQYSLGVMAYQMLSGRLPFVGESTVDIIKQQCFDQPPPLAALRPNLPRGLGAIVGRALAKSPEDRFPSVHEFAGAFTASLRGDTTTPHLRTAAADSPSRTRWKAILGTLIGVAALGIAGVVLWLRGGAQTTSSQQTADSARVEDSSVGRSPRRPVVPPREAHLILQAIPRGATVALNGMRVQDSVLVLRPEERYIVTISLPGYLTSVDTLILHEGEHPVRSVQLKRTGPAQPAESGYMSIATDLASNVSITINGHPVINPIFKYKVPAGVVRLRFDVVLDTVDWVADTQVTVTARAPFKKHFSIADLSRIAGAKGP